VKLCNLFERNIKLMYKISVPVAATDPHFKKEETLNELKRCGAARVALAIARELDYSFTSPENLKILKELVAYYKENGFETIIWLGETFGHTVTKVGNPSNYQYIHSMHVGETGAFCPLGKNFKNDFCTWVKNIAECGPDMIMLDDDFRLDMRGRDFGCFCDLHMAKIEEELGEKITPQELKPYLVSGGKNKYRSAWIKAQNDSMINFAKALRRTLDSVSPTIRLGVCACYNWGYIHDVTDVMAGDTKPFVRLIGAPYWEEPLGVLAEYQRTEANWCKNRGYEIFAEGDVYPRPRFGCSASRLECYDMILRASGETDGILKYMLDYVSYPTYETGYIDNMVKNMPLYEEIDKHFCGKKCVGLRPYNVMKLHEDAEVLETDDIQKYLEYPSLFFLAANSLPITYEDGYVNILFGENARHIKEHELKNGNIIDITAAKILMGRGIDVGIENLLNADEYQVQGFADVPQEYFPNEDLYTRLDPGPEVSPIKTADRVDVLSYIKKGSNMYPCAYTYENADGIKFLVFNFDANVAKNKVGWFTSYARRRQVENAVMWISKDSLPAHIDGNYPYLYTMAKEDNASLTVGLWNLFEDTVDNAKIKITKSFKSATFINCEGHIENDTIILDTPLHPYKFAAFVIRY